MADHNPADIVIQYYFPLPLIQAFLTIITATVVYFRYNRLSKCRKPLCEKKKLSKLRNSLRILFILELFEILRILVALRKTDYSPMKSNFTIAIVIIFVCCLAILFVYIASKKHIILGKIVAIGYILKAILTTFRSVRYMLKKFKQKQANPTLTRLVNG